MSDVRIEPLQRQREAQAVQVLARAFVTNPLHVAAFGPAPLGRNQTFFRIGLEKMKGPKWVATDGGEILGVVHWVRSPGCQFSGAEKLAMMPAMLAGFGGAAAMRIGQWLAAWSKHDPESPHSHLGPIGVVPEAQGRRIGGRLMQLYCDDLDRDGGNGYLETDRPENVAFYRRFGFETTAEIEVLGVPNFLMQRPSSRRG